MHLRRPHGLLRPHGRQIVVGAASGRSRRSRGPACVALLRGGGAAAAAAAAAHAPGHAAPRALLAGGRRRALWVAASGGHHANGVPVPSPGHAAVRISVRRELPFGSSMRVVGDADALGAWSVEQGLKLQWGDGHVWSTQLELPPGKHAFKFAVVGGSQHNTWEPGPNRLLVVPKAGMSIALETEWAEDEPVEEGEEEEEGAAAAAAAAASREDGEAPLEDDGTDDAIDAAIAAAAAASANGNGRAAPPRGPRRGPRRNGARAGSAPAPPPAAPPALVTLGAGDASLIEDVGHALEELEALKVKVLSEVQQFTARMEGVKDAVEVVRADVEQLWGDVDDARQHIASDDEEMSTLKGQVSEVREVAITSQRDMAELRDRVGAVELGCRVVEDVVNEMQAITGRVEGVKETVGEWRAAAMNAKHEMVALREDIGSMQVGREAVAAVMEEVQQLTHRLEGFRNSVESVRADVNQLWGDMDTTRQHLTSSEGIVRVLRQQLDEWRNTTAASDREVADLRDRLGAVETRTPEGVPSLDEFNQLSTRMEGVAEVVDGVKADMSQLWGSIDEARQRIGEDSSLPELREQVEEWRTAAQGALDDVNELRERLGSIESRSRAVDEVTQDLRQLSNRFKGVADTVEAVRADVGQLWDDMDDTRKNMTDSQQVVALQKQVEELKEATLLAQREIADRVKAVEEDSGVVDDVMGELRKLTSRMQRVKDTVEAVRADVGQLWGDVDEAHKGLESEESELKALRQQVEDWRAATEASNKQVEELRERLAGVEGRGEVVEEIDREVGHMASTVDGVRRTVERFKGDISTLQKDMDSTRRQVANGEGEHNRLVQQMEEWRAAANASNKLVDELKERLAHIEWCREASLQQQPQQPPQPQPQQQQQQQQQQCIGSALARSGAAEETAREVRQMGGRLDGVAGAVEAVRSDVGKLWSDMDGTRKRQEGDSRDVASLRKQLEEWRTTAGTAQSELRDLRHRLEAMEGGGDAVEVVSKELKHFTRRLEGFQEAVEGVRVDVGQLWGKVEEAAGDATANADLAALREQVSELQAVTAASQQAAEERIQAVERALLDTNQTVGALADAVRKMLDAGDLASPSGAARVSPLRRAPAPALAAAIEHHHSPPANGGAATNGAAAGAAALDAAGSRRSRVTSALADGRPEELEHLLASMHINQYLKGLVYMTLKALGLWAPGLDSTLKPWFKATYRRKEGELWARYNEEWGREAFDEWRGRLKCALDVTASTDPELRTHMLWCIAVLARLVPELAEVLESNRQSQVLLDDGGEGLDIVWDDFARCSEVYDSIRAAAALESQTPLPQAEAAAHYW